MDGYTADKALKARFIQALPGKRDPLVVSLPIKRELLFHKAGKNGSRE